MKKNLKTNGLFLLFLSFFLVQYSYGQRAQKDFYQIKIYQLKNDGQIQKMDSYLKDNYLPALKRAGIEKVGVFKPIANDTAAVKRIIVFIPFKSLREWMRLPDVLAKDAAFIGATKPFREAAYNDAPYERMESILAEAMDVQPNYTLSTTTTPKSERVYELRSYESPTESLFEKKYSMFNEAGEVDIFKRLGFGAVFYSKVISGSRMPNLMYMTTFDNMQSRNDHWKSFSNDPAWKTMNSNPIFEGKVSVSRNETILMHPTDYSDI